MEASQGAGAIAGQAMGRFRQFKESINGGVRQGDDNQTLPCVILIKAITKLYP